MTPPEVTILSATATLIEPSPIAALALARDSDDAAVNVALAAAALRMCWPSGVAWPVRPLPREWRPGQDIVRYGAGVYDALRAGTKGVVPFADLLAVLREAHAWAGGSLLTQAEVDAAADFSEPPQGG